MASNPKQLHQHHANDLGALRHFHTGHVFNIHDVRKVVDYPAQVINSIGVGNVRVPGLTFGHFFLRAVVVSNIGDRLHDDLAIKL